MATKQPLPLVQPAGGAWSFFCNQASLTKNRLPSASLMSEGRWALPSGGNGEATLLLQVAPQSVEVFWGDQPLMELFLPPMESSLPLSSSGTITEWRPPVRPPMSRQRMPSSVLRQRKLEASTPSMAKYIERSG